MLALTSVALGFNSPSSVVTAVSVRAPAASMATLPIAGDFLASRESLGVETSPSLVGLTGKVVPTKMPKVKAMESAFVYESRDSMGNAIGTCFTGPGGPASKVKPAYEMSGTFCYDRNTRNRWEDPENLCNH